MNTGVPIMFFFKISENILFSTLPKVNDFRSYRPYYKRLIALFPGLTSLLLSAMIIETPD